MRHVRICFLINGALDRRRGYEGAKWASVVEGCFDVNFRLAIVLQFRSASTSLSPGYLRKLATIFLLNLNSFRTFERILLIKFHKSEVSITCW